MKQIRTLIVDDEPLARQGLQVLAGADPALELVGECADGRSALEHIRRLRPDLVFLDIQMPQMDGFEVLSALPPAERPVVVFVTAFERHAIRAFEICAVDYLLKPYSNARFTAALNRAKETVHARRATGLSQRVEQLLEYVRRLETSTPASVPSNAASDIAREDTAAAASAGDTADRIVLKADGALHFIKSHDVIWIEAQGDFVKVQTSDRTQLVRETLQAIERRLDPTYFLRIHRSFLVNLDHVRRVETALYGDYSVFMSDGTKLRLSRNYRAKLKMLARSRAAG